MSAAFTSAVEIKVTLGGRKDGILCCDIFYVRFKKSFQISLIAALYLKSAMRLDKGKL